MPVIAPPLSHSLTRMYRVVAAIPWLIVRMLQVSSLQKNQHYVWQRYLRAWAVDGQVWCLRVPATRAFRTNPSNIGSETFFYRLHELDSDDLAHLERLISLATSDELKELNRGWIDIFQMPFLLRKALSDHGTETPGRAQLDQAINIIEKTISEQYHTGVEQRAIPILESLKNGDSSFYADPDKTVNFLHFITLQYFRTAKMRNTVTQLPNLSPHNSKRTWPIESYIYATNLSASLFAKRDRYCISFLENQSPVPFIAGDQPVINLNGHKKLEACLFYPVSPNMSMIYAADRNRFPSGRFHITQMQAETYNFQIYSNSDSQIYATNGAYLEALATLTKDKTLG